MCTNCIENTYLTDFSCAKTCKSDMYPDKSEWACKPCHSSCLSCSGSSFQDCTACAPTKILISGSCVQTCLPGKFWNPADGTCQSCSYPCATCAGNQSLCNSCLDKYFFHQVTNSCNEGCSEGSFGNPDNFICETACKSGQYANNLRICLKCSEPCLECELFGTGIECTRCDDYKILYNKKCIDNCPLNYFHDGNKHCIGKLNIK